MNFGLAECRPNGRETSGWTGKRFIASWVQAWPTAFRRRTRRVFSSKIPIFFSRQAAIGFALPELLLAVPCLGSGSFVKLLRTIRAEPFGRKSLGTGYAASEKS